MTTRTVTGIVLRGDESPFADASVTFHLRKGSYTGEGIYPPSSVTVTTDEQGVFEIDLWTNTEGVTPSEYLVVTPNAESYRFVLDADDSPITLPEILVAQEVGSNWADADLNTAMDVYRSSLAAITGSGLIGWTQAGTAAVIRTVRDKLRDVINLRDVLPAAERAAIADGTTTYDAAPALSAVLTYAASVGAPVTISAGTYNLGSVVSLPSYTTLEIEPGATLRATTRRQYYFQNADSGGNTSIAVRGLRWDGSDIPTTGATASDALFRFDECENVVIEGCHLDGTNTHMLVLAGCTNFRIVGNTISNAGAAEITQNTVPIGNGIVLEDCSNGLIEANTITNSWQCAIFVNTNGGTSHDLKIIKNEIDTCLDNGIRLQPASTISATLTPTGNTTNSSTTITGVSSTGSVSLRSPISGAGIPDGTLVTAKTADTLTLSQAATATATGVTLTILGYNTSTYDNIYGCHILFNTIKNVTIDAIRLNGKDHLCMGNFIQGDTITPGAGIKGDGLLNTAIINNVMDTVGTGIYMRQSRGGGDVRGVSIGGGAILNCATGVATVSVDGPFVIDDLAIYGIVINDCSEWGVSLKQASYGSVKGVHVKNAESQALNVTNDSSHLTIEGCTFHSIGAEVVRLDGQDINLRGGIVMGTGVYDGIRSNGGGDAHLIEGVEIRDVVTGIHYRNNGLDTNNVKVLNNNIHTAQTGIAFNALNGTEWINNVVVRGNSLGGAASTARAIWCERVINLEVSHNFTDTWADAGIRLDDCQNYQVLANKVKDSQTGVGASSYAGILLNQTASGILSHGVVDHNICWDSRSGGSRTQTHGLKTAGSLDGLRIGSGNDFSRNINTPGMTIGAGATNVDGGIYSATLNFSAPAVVPGPTGELTIAANGAAVAGTKVVVYPPVALGTSYRLDGYVSAPNTVSVYWTQIIGAAADPDASGGTYTVRVEKALL